LNANYRALQRNYQSTISFEPRKENDKDPAGAKNAGGRAPRSFSKTAPVSAPIDDNVRGEVGGKTAAPSGLAASLPTIPLGFTMAVPQNARRAAGTGQAAIVAGESDTIVAEAAARIFADLADPQTINQAKTDAWREPLWRALGDAGLPLAWVPENLGGSGASIADGFAILGVAGRFALAAPLAETLLAGWLLARAELAAPAGAMTVAPARPSDRIVVNDDGTLSGRAGAVPFATQAEHIAVLAESGSGTVVALVEAKNCRVSDGHNLAGDSAGSVIFERVQPLRSAPASIDRTALMLMGAAVRSVETAGALEAILSLSVAYANERVAFERPLAKFQAIQQNLARLAGEVAAALAVAGSAADTLAQSDDFDDAAFLEAASAKIRCAEAAAEGSAIAHQVFGAIGFTQEHILHRFTLRMLSWRDDFGNESYWAAELGRHVARRGADEFWPLVASR
jgi:acyl-CoA dehydrogenase